MNRSIYSKKIVLAIALAVVMIASAFVVSTASLAEPPQAGVTLSGWTLKPEANKGWTNGNVKGYSEGDVVPVKLTVAVNGDSQVKIVVGFEWGLGTIADPQLRGFDREVKYPWTGDPDPLERAFNDPLDYVGSPGEPTPPSGTNGPFSVGGGGGATITSQHYIGPVADGAPHWKIWDEWELQVTLDPSKQEVCLLTGGLLYITTDDQLGAAYFPGSSLHVRLIEVDGKKSAEDISLNVEEVMSPPDVVLEKFNTPSMVVEGDTMMIKIRWENLGQADTQNLVLWDIIPTNDDGDPLLQYAGEPGKMWSEQDGVQSPIVDVDPPEIMTVPYDFPDDDPDAGTVEVQAWVWYDQGWIAKGTGVYDATPITVYYLEFEVTVIDWEFCERTNYARLWYCDDHNLGPCFADAHSHFKILRPGITIDKVEKNGLTCAAGMYVWSVDSDGEPIFYPGDTLTYVITVTNPSPDVAMDYVVYDPIIAIEKGWPGTTPIMSGTLAPGDDISEEFTYLVKGNEPEPEAHGFKFRNTASVIAVDVFDLGEKVTDSDYWDIDILHPGLSIKKTACSEVAAVGEKIWYTVEVENVGDATLEWFWIYDLMMSGDPLYVATDDNPDDDLSPGEKLILESVYTGLPGHVYVPELAHVIQQGDVDQKTGLITNTVWIDAWDTQDHYLFRYDSLSLRHVTPGIEITKTPVDEDGEPITQVGLSGVVRYEIAVENTGDVGLWWFYWDDFADTTGQWTPVPDSVDPIWTNIGDYYVDGCWAVELGEGQSPGEYDGVYCGQVPIAEDDETGVVAISTHDTFSGDEFSYEVKIYPHDPYWRAGVLLRYDVAAGDGYLACIYDSGVALFKMVGGVLVLKGAQAMPVSSGMWHTLKVVVWDDIDSFFDVYVDGDLEIQWSDTSPLPAGKIGLAVWDEGVNPVHVHFDDVLVKDLDDNVLLVDHFEMLEPEITPPSMPGIPFPCPPGVPEDLACLYQARLASGYLEPSDTDVRYYTYEVQKDDPDPLDDIVYVYGWITSDGTEQTMIQDPDYYVDDDDDASVRIRGWIYGYVYHDVNLNDVEQGAGESAMDGWPVHLYMPDPDNPGDWILVDSTVSASGGYYLFDYLPPGPYKVYIDIYDNDYFSTNPKDLADPEGVWEDVSVVAGFGTRQDFGLALYSYLEGYKWNDWNMNRNRDQPGGVWEPYLNGWVIMCAGWEYDELVNGDPPPGVDPHHVQTAITGEDGIPGWFQFKVKPGIWTIWEVMPEDNPLTPLVDESAWYQTFPTTPGMHENVEIGEGSIISDKHFGNVPLTTVWGYKFYDKIDLDGVLDEGDIGLSGWTMTLTGHDVLGNDVSKTATSGRRAVDVIFAIDLSGSMADDLAQIRNAVTNIMAALASAGVDARFGVMSFVDYPGFYSTTKIGSVPVTYSATYGSGSTGDYAYQLDQPLTSDTDDVEDAMDGLYIHSGMDSPQDYARVIHEAWNDASVGWRYCTERVLVLFGDDAAHDSDFDYDNDGTKENTGGDPGRDEVLNTDDDLDFETEVANAAAHGVHIMSVLSPSPFGTPGVAYEWGYMASETGGSYFGIADVDDVQDAILDLIPLGYFVFTDLKPGTYTLGEVEPLGQEDYWYITTPQGQLQITISKPTVPGLKIHQDIGNMRLAKVWGYKFLDEYGGTQEDPVYPDGVFDQNNEGGLPSWPIHWKLVGGIEVDPSPVLTEVDDDQTGGDETGLYEIWLVPGDYEVWEDEEFLNTWEATTPWKVWITIPAHPWGTPVIKRIDFGNTHPLSDPKVPFVLQPGWNLWSSPVRVHGLTAGGLLEAIGPAGLLVTGLDEGSAKYYSYMADWDASYDFPIVAGDGYYIYVTERVYFTLSGDLIGPSQVELKAGWNIVGYSRLTTTKASALLDMVSGCDALLVTGLDGKDARYYSYMDGWDSAYDFTLSAGQAFFIWVDGPGTLVY